MKKLDILIALISILNNSGTPKCEHPVQVMLSPYTISGVK